MAGPQQICRLCFNVLSDNFELLDHHKAKMIEKISLNLDLALTEQPLVCVSCRDILQQSHDFKMACLNNKRLYSDTFLVCDGNRTISLEIVPRNADETVVKHEKESICCLCLKCLDNDSFVKFDTNDDMFLKDMLNKCLPEIDFHGTNQQLICHNCMKNCQDMFSFITNCYNGEDNLKKYVQTNGTTGNGTIDLSDALKFIHGAKTVETDVDFVKREAFVYNLNSSCGTVMVKTEPTEETKDPEIFKALLDSTNCDRIVKEEIETGIKSEVDISLDTEIKTDSNSIQENAVPTHESKSNIVMQRCPKCSYQTKYKHNMKMHLLRHEDISKITMHKCTQCNYESKYKEYVRKHAIIHKTAFEINMHKCTECGYATKRRGYLTKHMLGHKDTSEVNTHKCTECNYETVHREYLRKHLLVHKDPSEISLFKCTECGYAVKRKDNLQRHMLKHKDSSEVIRYRCTRCNYESIYKSTVRKHITRKHKNDVQEATIVQGFTLLPVFTFSFSL